jgi:hypothetical protein
VAEHTAGSTPALGGAADHADSSGAVGTTASRCGGPDGAGRREARLCRGPFGLKLRARHMVGVTANKGIS